jgi:hypothetical protein
VKGRITRFKMRRKTLLAFRPCVLNAGKELVYVLSELETYHEAEFKGDVLINLAEEL